MLGSDISQAELERKKERRKAKKQAKVVKTSPAKSGNRTPGKND